MRHHVLANPAVEIRIPGASTVENGAGGWARGKIRRGKVRAYSEDLVLRQRQRAVANAFPFLLDLATDFISAGFVDKDLDARLVFVVTATELIVDAQDRLAVGEQILLGQEIPDLVADKRCPAEAATDIDREAEIPVVSALEMQTDVMDLRRSAVVFGAADRNLELPRQPNELRMERRPLAQDLRIGTRVGDFIPAAPAK